jgi:hypothetical protein
MIEDAKYDKLRAARTADKFDRVLKRHIRRLLDVNDSDNLPPYSLNMIACLLVLSEREKEIAGFPDAPPNRYNRETFLRDLDEIGIDPDDIILLELQNLSQTGYIKISGNEEYQVCEPATRLLSMLDGIFPTLPGLSLVAYILQAIEEVLSGRKEMILAIRQFDETLLTRGESVSKQRIDAQRRQRAAAAAMKRIDPAAQKQRETYLEKLKALRSKQREQSLDSAVVLTSGYTRKIEIRELFPKEPDSMAEESMPETSTSVASDAGQSIDVAPLPIDNLELDLSAETRQQTLETTPVSPVNQPAGPVEETTAPAAAVPAEAVVDSPPETSIEDLIAKKIQAFEEQLAMSCPVCKEGKVLTDITEKEKTYYYCSNKACGLVSWGKPHHMACPLCENPFLVEFQQKDDRVGLKCPRATCSFQHLNFDGKTLPPLPGTAGSDTVRKVVVRKKAGAPGTQRRLVRRKK